MEARSLNLWTTRSGRSLCLPALAHALPSTSAALLPTLDVFTLCSSMTSSGKLPLILKNDLCCTHRTTPCPYHKSIHFLSVSSSWSEDKKFMNHLKLYQKCTCTSSQDVYLGMHISRSHTALTTRCVPRGKLFNHFKPRGSTLNGR